MSFRATLVIMNILLAPKYPNKKLWETSFGESRLAAFHRSDLPEAASQAFKVKTFI